MVAKRLSHQLGSIARAAAGFVRHDVRMLGAGKELARLSGFQRRRIGGQRAKGLELRHRRLERDEREHAGLEPAGRGVDDQLRRQDLLTPLPLSRLAASGDGRMTGCGSVMSLPRTSASGHPRARGPSGRVSRAERAAHYARGVPCPRSRTSARAAGSQRRGPDSGELDAIRGDLHPRHDPVGQGNGLAAFAADQCHVADPALPRPVRQHARVHRAEILGVARDGLTRQIGAGPEPREPVPVIANDLPAPDHQRRDQQDRGDAEANLNRPAAPTAPWGQSAWRPTSLAARPRSPWVQTPSSGEIPPSEVTSHRLLESARGASCILHDASSACHARPSNRHLFSYRERLS